MTLEDEIDITRGNMLVRENNSPGFTLLESNLLNLRLGQSFQRNQIGLIGVKRCVSKPCGRHSLRRSNLGRAYVHHSGYFANRNEFGNF